MALTSSVLTGASHDTRESHWLSGLDPVAAGR